MQLSVGPTGVAPVVDVAVAAKILPRRKDSGMKRWAGVVASVLLAVPCASHGAAQGIDPIDKSYSECIKIDYSTDSMDACANEALRSWEKALDQAYGALSKRLPGKARKALSVAQARWAASRDADFRYIDCIHELKRGVAFAPISTNEKIDLVKQRTLRLRQDLESLPGK
jgi:uncharacterized protein YecT (DUF1311 family)